MTVTTSATSGAGTTRHVVAASDVQRPPVRPGHGRRAAGVEGRHHAATGNRPDQVGVERGQLLRGNPQLPQPIDIELAGLGRGRANLTA